MWFIQRRRSLNICILLSLILFIIYLSITFYDNKFSPKLHFKFPQNLTTIINSSDEYLHVQLDLTSSQAICQTHDYLIIYILSSITNIQRRNAIRSTWASKQAGICFVFILGQAPRKILSNADTIQMNINNEQEKYRDIVQINHIETYANVIYKEIAALQWSHYFYLNIPYLFKTDDDLIVDTILISSIIQLLLKNVSTNTSFISKHRPSLSSAIISSDRKTFFRGGWAMGYQPTVRDGGKFSVSKDVWPHSVLPIYCSGFGWIMSANIRNQLVKASHTYPLKKTAWVGDVFLSGFLAKAAKVTCTEISIDFEQTASANCSCLMVKNPMVTVCSSSYHAGGRGTEEQRYLEYKRAWKVIQARHNLGNTTINEC